VTDWDELLRDRERQRHGAVLADLLAGGDGTGNHREQKVVIPGSQPSQARGPLRTRAAHLSRVRPIRWAWERRLPLGYLSLLLGAEGVGKGTVAAWIIARATRGQLPGDLAGCPARVLLVGDEDSFDSVIVPRLYAAGADLTRVDTLSEEDDDELLDLRRDGAQLRELVVEGCYRLIYLDALLDVLGVDTDDWRAKAVRDALRPLRRTVRELDVSVLASVHPNKGQRNSFRDLVSGSFAFNASSRSSLLLAPHPDDDDRRVLVRGKGNLSAAPPSFEFALQGRDLEINGHGFSLPIVADPCEGDLTVEDIIKPEREAPVRDTLIEQIDQLGTGEVQTRADIARAVGKEPDDRSVGRTLDKLEEQDRWEKVGRGKWRRIGTSS
jgi:AAA domain-containing protein